MSDYTTTSNGSCNNADQHADLRFHQSKRAVVALRRCPFRGSPARQIGRTESLLGICIVFGEHRLKMQNPDIVPNITIRGSR
jgi:hypothetical protein